jgi:hypothetical protein
MSMERCPVCGNLVFTTDSRAKSDKMLREENERLRELVEEAVEAASLDDVRDWAIGHRLRLIRQARELGIETDDV